MHQILLIHIKVGRPNNLRSHRRPHSHNLWAFLVIIIIAWLVTHVKGFRKAKNRKNTYTIVQLSPGPKMSQSRSSTMCDANLVRFALGPRGLCKPTHNYYIGLNKKSPQIVVKDRRCARMQIFSRQTLNYAVAKTCRRMSILLLHATVWQ